ncbi:hypothetical protein ACWCPF_22485 [Streptomyces sp. NPDC001858]
MPFPLPRRSLLASAAGAALLVGCSSGPEESEESPDAGPSAEERARARGAQDSNGLLVRYDAALAAHPALAGLLGPLRAEVARHVEAFGGREKAAPSATATASAAASPSPTSTASAVPATEKDALVGLAGAERALADRRAAELVDLPGEPARLLASVAAAGAAHAYLLTEGTR